MKSSARDSSRTYRPSCLPDDLRRELNNGNESTLFTGLQTLRTEVFDVLKPDLVLVFDSHWFTTVEFVVTAAERRMGFFTSEELPRGMSSVPYDMPGNPDFARLIGKIADETDDCWITPIDNEHLPVTYATLNFLSFLQGDEAWASIGVCQTAENRDFATVGRVVAEAVAQSDLRVVVIASGALSHTFHKLRNLRDSTRRRRKSTSTPTRRATGTTASSTRWCAAITPRS